MWARMRYDDHPRPWSELQTFLTPSELAGCLAFAQQRGINLKTSEPGEAERMYSEWRSAGAPECDPA